MEKTETGKTGTNPMQKIVGKMGGLVGPIVQETLPMVLKGYLEDLKESEESTGALREVVMAIFDNLIPRKHAVKATKKHETLKEYMNAHWKPPEEEEEVKKVREEHPEREKYWRMRRVIYAFVGITKKIMEKYDYHPSVAKAQRKLRPYFRKTDLGILLDYQVGQEWYRKQVEELVHWIWPQAPATEAEKEDKNDNEGEEDE